MTAALDAHLRRLHLANTRRIWAALCDRAEREQWTYQAFLETLCGEEISHRAGTRLGRLAKKAGFPFLKTVDDFDFTLQSELRLATLGSFLGPEFVTEGRNLILIGKPGRGKTHLAIAIAYKAIQNGFDARFTTAAALIDDLSRASHKTTFRKALATYVQPHVLVVDELGYLACTPDAANVLYHVVNERHLKRRPMIFTTNKPLRSWGRILHDADLGDVIVDRLLERARVLKLDGPSIRSRHVPEADLEDTPSTPARVSGKDRPEFPEPTAAPESCSGSRGAESCRWLRRWSCQGFNKGDPPACNGDCTAGCTWSQRWLQRVELWSVGAGAVVGRCRSSSLRVPEQ